MVKKKNLKILKNLKGSGRSLFDILLEDINGN